MTLQGSTLLYIRPHHFKECFLSVEICFLDPGPVSLAPPTLHLEVQESQMFFNPGWWWSVQSLPVNPNGLNLANLSNFKFSDSGKTHSAWVLPVMDLQTLNQFFGQTPFLLRGSFLAAISQSFSDCKSVPYLTAWFFLMNCSLVVLPSNHRKTLLSSDK